VRSKLQPALTVASLIAPLAAAPSPVALAAAQPVRTGGQPFACASPASLRPRPGTVSVSATLRFGGVQAIFRGVTASSPGVGLDGFRQPGLTVTAPGGRARSVPLRPPWGFSVVPGAVQLMSLTNGVAGSPFCVARFGSPSPEYAVLVGAYSGGAHCCTWVAAYVAAPRAVASTKPIWLEIGNPGVQLRAYQAKTLLVTADNSFAYTFDSYAGSGMPVRVMELRGDKFVSTTRAYPALVAADAHFWWVQYKHVSAPKGEEPNGGLGLLAAWAADECLLGRSANAWATVAQLERQGRLSGGTSPWPKGAAYVRALHSFLAKQGYCPEEVHRS